MAKQFTATSLAATTSGTVALGKRMISFLASSDYVGTVNGVTFPPGGVKSLSVTDDNTLDAISYTVTSGTLYIDYL